MKGLGILAGLLILLLAFGGAAFAEEADGEDIGLAVVSPATSPADVAPAAPAAVATPGPASFPPFAAGPRPPPGR